MTLVEAIRHATKEGAGLHIYDGDNCALRLDEVKKALLKCCWLECTPNEEVAKEFGHIKEASFFVYDDRYAVFGKTKIPNPKEPSDLVWAKALIMPETIAYAIKKATEEHYGLSYYSSPANFSMTKAEEALVKCGWVAFEPSKKVRKAYANIENVSFYERGDMFALTGNQFIPVTDFTGKRYKECKSLLIINYKERFAD